MTVNDSPGASFNVYDPALTVDELRDLARSIIARLPDAAVRKLLDEVLCERARR